MRAAYRDALRIVCFILFNCISTARNTPKTRPLSAPDSILEVDVCIIGGGAAGTYAAIKSRDLNKTVVVIEKQGRLGGHTKTYIDPASEQPIELGVAEYENSSLVRDWFARFDIPLYTYNYTRPGVTSTTVDFHTGVLAPAASNPSDLLNAWDAYQAQASKYPFLTYSLAHVPYPVPSDLLLPFGQFIQKYSLQGAVPYLSLYGQGWGNFVTLPTLLAIKYFPPGFFSPASLVGTGSGAVATKDNSLLYEKAQAEFDPAAVLLNSTVQHMDRTTPDFARITVQTPTGVKHIRARKIIATIPPILANLRGFDLNETELQIFRKFRYHSWYVGLVKNSGIPSNLTLFNYGANNNTQNYNLPLLPAAYDFYATRVPDLHYFTFGGNDSQLHFSAPEVRANLETSLTKLRDAGVVPSKQVGTPGLSIVDFTSHTPYEVYVSAEEIARGFYNELFSLQGQRHTYWTGAAFVTHSSAAVWNFTGELVAGMWADG